MPSLLKYWPTPPKTMKTATAKFTIRLWKFAVSASSYVGSCCVAARGPNREATYKISEKSMIAESRVAVYRRPREVGE